jgi:DNA gyrase subunit A
VATKKSTVSKDSYQLRDPGIQIEEVELGAFTERSLRIYGEEVNLNRAVPDFRDGLKPVGRRILWALQGLPKDQMLKTSRLVGEVIGKFHPHGSSSVVGAIGTTVVSNANPIAGVGNWGSIIDSIGADRYTNVLLSKYGKTFFHPSYLPLSTLIPNYDDKDVEPLFIPALLPNLLLNGAEGIGLGLTTKIPAFTPASLLPLLADMAEDKDLPDKEIAKRLEFSHQYGGVAVKSKANFLKVIDLLNATSASIQWTSPFEVDRDKKCITISNFGPEVNPITLIENKVKPLTEVSSVHSGKGVSYSIQIRKDLNFNEFDKFVEKFTKMVSTSISYQLYVTSSKMVEGKKKVKFANVTLKDLMGRWVKYRIALEVASLKYRVSVHEKRDLYLSLLIRACDSLDPCLH